MKKQIIFYYEGKEVLHKQLKVLCAKDEKSMNKTIIQLIENYVEESKQK